MKKNRMSKKHFYEQKELAENYLYQYFIDNIPAFPEVDVLEMGCGEGGLMVTLWKVFKKEFKSTNGNIKWKVGEWQHQDDKIKLCKNGFHASEKIIDAMRHTDTEIIAQVEVKGKSDIGKDKQAWSDMRIINSYEWTKKDSVRVAIYAAEQVIDIYEKKYPDDDSPRKAIKAAKQWLEKPTKINTGAAAEAAWVAREAAWTAWVAREAAWAVGEVAWVASAAAGAAAGAAAEAAGAAAGAASAAASAAAREAAWAAGAEMKDKIENYIHSILEEK